MDRFKILIIDVPKFIMNENQPYLKNVSKLCSAIENSQKRIGIEYQYLYSKYLRFSPLDETFEKVVYKKLRERDIKIVGLHSYSPLELSTVKFNLDSKNCELDLYITNLSENKFLAEETCIISEDENYISEAKKYNYSIITDLNKIF